MKIVFLGNKMLFILGKVALSFVSIMAMFIMVVSVRCTLFKRSTLTPLPMHIYLVDESRIENQKIRCIIIEFILMEMVKQGGDWLVLYKPDNGNFDSSDRNLIDYIVCINVMEYGLHDIDSQQDKILTSLKILDPDNDIVMGTFIESAVGKDNETMCRRIAHTLGTQVVKHLSAYMTYLDKVPDVLDDMPDSTGLDN